MFNEQHAGPGWLRGVGLVAAGVTAAAGVVLVEAIARSWGTDAVALLLVSLVVLVGIVGLAALTGLINRISVRVCDKGVVGRLSPFRVFVIPVNEITAVHRSTVTVVEAGGIGYRLKPAVRYLLFTGGPAVTVETTQGRSYVIRSDNAEQMIAAIDELSSLTRSDRGNGHVPGAGSAAQR